MVQITERVRIPSANGHQGNGSLEKALFSSNGHGVLPKKEVGQTLFEKGMQKSIAHIAQAFDLAALARRGQKELYGQERSFKNFLKSHTPEAPYDTLVETVVFAGDQWKSRKEDIERNTKELISLLFPFDFEDGTKQNIQNPALMAYNQFVELKNPDAIRGMFKAFLKGIKVTTGKDFSWLEKYFFQFTIKELLEKASTETEQKLETKRNDRNAGRRQKRMEKLGQKAPERLQGAPAQHEVNPHKMILTDEQFAGLKELATAAGHKRSNLTKQGFVL